MNKFSVGRGLGVLFVLLVALTSVYAIKSMPHRFYGTVTINGSPAVNGIRITAHVNAVEVASTTTTDGHYSFFDIRDPNGNNNGKTIEFFVEGIKAADAVFENGAKTELNLSAEVETPISCGDGTCNSGETCATCETDCGTCSSPPSTPSNTGGGGSGGGSSGGGGGSLQVAVTGTCTDQNILVTVKTSGGNPSRFVRVSILKDTNELVSDLTAADGTVRFVIADAGDYTLQAEKSGYPKKKLNISLTACETQPAASGQTPPVPNTSGTPIGHTPLISGSAADDASVALTNTNGTDSLPSTTGFLGLNLQTGNMALGLLVILALLGAGSFAFFVQKKRRKKQTN